MSWDCYHVKPQSAHHEAHASLAWDDSRAGHLRSDRPHGLVRRSYRIVLVRSRDLRVLAAAATIT